MNLTTMMTLKTLMTLMTMMTLMTLISCCCCCCCYCSPLSSFSSPFVGAYLQSFSGNFSMTQTEFYKMRLLAIVNKGSVAFHILQHFTAKLFYYSFAKSVENLIWQLENRKFCKKATNLKKGSKLSKNRNADKDGIWNKGALFEAYLFSGLCQLNCPFIS